MGRRRIGAPRERWIAKTTGQSDTMLSLGERSAGGDG